MRRILTFSLLGLGLLFAGCAQQPATSTPTTPPQQTTAKKLHWAPASPCDQVLSTEDTCYVDVEKLTEHNITDPATAIHLRIYQQESIMFFSSDPEAEFKVHVSNIPGHGAGPGFFRPLPNTNGRKRISTGPPKDDAAGKWYKIKIKYTHPAGKPDKDPHIIIDAGP
jgi:hypothetical protein